MLPSVYQALVEEPGLYIYPLEEEWVLTVQPHLHSQPALETSPPYQQHLSKPAKEIYIFIYYFQLNLTLRNIPYKMNNFTKTIKY